MWALRSEGAMIYMHLNSVKYEYAHDHSMYHLTSILLWKQLNSEAIIVLGPTTSGYLNVLTITLHNLQYKSIHTLWISLWLHYFSLGLYSKCWVY